METSKKSILKIISIVTLGTVTGVYMAGKVIKATGKQYDRDKLGFDGSFIVHNAGVIDFIHQFKQELKFGLQRFTRGYDDLTLWSFYDHFDKLIVEYLRWFIENRHGSPILNDWTKDNCHNKFTEVLQEMLYYFEQSQEKYCKEKNEYDIKIWNKYTNRNNEIEKYQDENRKKGFEMLNKYYVHLWD